MKMALKHSKIRRMVSTVYLNDISIPLVEMEYVSRIIEHICISCLVLVWLITILIVNKCFIYLAESMLSSIHDPDILNENKMYLFDA